MGFKHSQLFIQYRNDRAGENGKREKKVEKETGIQLASMKTVWSATWISALNRFSLYANEKFFRLSIYIIIYVLFLIEWNFWCRNEKKKQHKTPWLHRKNMAMMRMNFNCICTFRRQEAQFLLCVHFTTQRPHKVWIH